jgi:hypothetical protein
VNELGTYSRAVLQLGNETGRALVDADARGLLGSEMDVELHGAVVASGTVTNAVIVDGKMCVTIETNGRSCAACGYIYTDLELDRAHVPPLGPVGQLTEVMPTFFSRDDYSTLPDWAPVCTEPVECRRRLADDTVPEVGA